MNANRMLWLTLYLLWIASELVIAVVTRTKRGSGDIRDRETMLLLWITIAASMTVCGFTQHYLHDWHPLPPVLHKAAPAILLIGLIIRLVSVVSLGKAFSANVAIRESQTLNQSGVYKFVRHPSYLGLVIIFLAVGLHSENPAGLFIAFLPTTAMLLYRIHIEEAALVTAFGPQYRTYMANTKRLVPWVY